MKRILFIVCLLFFTAGLMSSKAIEIESIQDSTELVECKYRQCNATAKSTGKRCKHCVSKKTDYQCWQHKD